MSLPAIEVSGLSKRYVIQHESRHDNLRDTLHHTARKAWRKLRWGTGFDTEEFMALNDVSFSVQPGEVVGIIGRNGAGKSTLLKILSRITEPTAGKVTIRGRVASLLEVGTGFHPDLTGRENVFLNGAILGMSRVEIRKKFDEIVAFAEVEKFLDTPVKRYSSGMYVRLAFAVAAHLEPEILIVDEVLAVGDAEFQKKCIGKMQNVASREGRTVLVVSHNITMVTSLCTQAMLLTQGRIEATGTAAEIASRYVSARTASAETRWEGGTGSDLVRLWAVRVVSDGKVSGQIPIESSLTLEIEFEVLRPASQIGTSLHLLDDRGNVVFCSGPPLGDDLAPGHYAHRCRIPGGLLNNLRYSVSVFIISGATNILVNEAEAVTFLVVETNRGDSGFHGEIWGTVRPQLSWEKARL